VKDLDAALGRVKKGDGKVMMGPMEVRAATASRSAWIRRARRSRSTESRGD